MKLTEVTHHFSRVTAVTLTILMLKVQGQAIPWRGTPIRYVDYDGSVDTFFDRVIGIIDDVPPLSNSPPALALQKYSLMATAVYITDELVLTSNNPFIQLCQKPDKIKDMKTVVLTQRFLNKEGKFLYLFSAQLVKCARQVIVPFLNYTAPSDMRHGRHRPLHDLMVVRLGEKVNFIKPIPKRETSLEAFMTSQYYHAKNGRYEVKTGPIQTDLARPGDVFESDLKFASLGHESDDHVKRILRLLPVYFDEDAIVDCDEWLPREWGIFICIINVNEEIGIASGGMLFSGDKLFGVGAFAIFKGKKGVLVFTDVRPYWDLLNRTCTESDQNLIMPKEGN